MKLSGLSHFRKLWGVIDQNLHPDTTYRLKIGNNYDTERYGGTKKFVLATTSVIFGGDNR